MRLTGLDTAFLCLDRDVSPMHLGALAIFRPVHPDDPGRLAALLADRARRLPQLRQRVQPAAPLSTQRSVQSRLWQVPGDLRDAVGTVAVQMSQATKIATSVLRCVRLPSPASPLVTCLRGGGP